MDVNTFADWVLAMLGASLCLIGLAAISFSILAQIKDKEASKDFRWTPIILGAVLIWFGVQLVDNFDNLRSEGSNESVQAGSR